MAASLQKSEATRRVLREIWFAEWQESIAALVTHIAAMLSFGPSIFRKLPSDALALQKGFATRRTQLCHLPMNPSFCSVCFSKLLIFGFFSPFRLTLDFGPSPPISLQIWIFSSCIRIFSRKIRVIWENLPRSSFYQSSATDMCAFCARRKTRAFQFGGLQSPWARSPTSSIKGAKFRL